MILRDKGLYLFYICWFFFVKLILGVLFGFFKKYVGFYYFFEWYTGICFDDSKIIVYLVKGSVGFLLFGGIEIYFLKICC